MNDKAPTKAEVKADKRAAALRANMQRRKAFVRGQKDTDKEERQQDKQNADSKNSQ